MSRILDVYLHAVLAGKLIQNDSGVLSFVYDPVYAGHKNPALSLSLPLRESPYEGTIAKAFFSGLLPDAILRHKLAKYLRVSEKNPFSLLEAIGGECAGAVSLYPEGTTPPKSKDDDIEILDDQKLKEMLVLLKRRPLLAGEEGGIRLSLAGAQDKIAVGVKDGRIALIKGTSPTTHILKPLIDMITDSVHNELFCMRLAALVRIDVARADIYIVDNTPCFLVERYDRMKNTDGIIVRLHQEDFCQALGVLPDMKYENEGGPSLKKCQDVLFEHSAKPAADQLSLLNRVIFNYLIGNADAHGKNFSLIYKDVKPQLAPAYDLLSTAIYPDVPTKMAMKIGGKYKPNDVFLRHWHRLVADTAAAKKNLEKQLLKMSKNMVAQAYMLKNTFEKEGIKSTIFDDICKVIFDRSKGIQDQIGLE